MQRTKVRHRSADGRPILCHGLYVNIDVRPTPALRRHRARIAGVLLAVALLVATVFAVTEIADATEQGPQRVPVSDPTHP